MAKNLILSLYHRNELKYFVGVLLLTIYTHVGLKLIMLCAAVDIFFVIRVQLAKYKTQLNACQLKWRQAKAMRVMTQRSHNVIITSL